ncbi:alpha/beta-hydrolase [Calocera viscosa TUFC12733]|uniref:Alpha/beta-hydrolase n=1 Tax=Calocera viscosa (strain TUFC12733) TaxID=1330018 RepID=A0A167Q5Q4_CALVF|nr:alpha/beta-hydrolase [Calocera viscosa TUFC12733]
MAKRDFSEDWSSFFSPSTRVRRGLCPVTLQDGLTESHALYFEQHGSGPEKMIFIMGLNSTSFSWGPQVNYFAAKPQYSVLVFDNRGVGHSEAPRGPYTTKGMAEDALALLDYMGWKGERDLHIVSISLGGMIALGKQRLVELVDRIPERVISLLLSVTTAGARIPWWNLSPWKGTTTLARMMLVKDPVVLTGMALEMIFPAPWLDAPAENDPQGRTNRQLKAHEIIERSRVTRKQTLQGSLSQMAAGLTHYVSPARLHKISRSIPKIIILTGDEDHLVAPRNSQYLKEQMPEAELIVWEKTGHALHQQWPGRYCELLERLMAEGREAVESGTFKP